MVNSMGRVLIFITQLRNLTDYEVGFRVPHGLHQISDLPSSRTRIVKQHRVLRLCRENRRWTVGIEIDGNYTGVELNSTHLLEYTRIIFRYDGNVLVVDGIMENHNSDYLLRLRYFGWMRNIFWDKRPRVEIARSDSREAKTFKYQDGLFGGSGGGSWDDGIYDGVRKIVLRHGLWIYSIQVFYQKNSMPVCGTKHGGDGGSETLIELKYPEEYLTAVSGTADTYVMSLTFTTNLEVYGPYGPEHPKGKPFAVEGEKILGIKGSSGIYLDAIGFHIKPF